MPIAFASKTFNTHQRNYSVTEKEGAAVVWAVDLFRPFLLGPDFVLETDHSALRQILTTKEPTGRLARWIIRLQEYGVTVVHRPGTTHGNADYLSRQTAENLMEAGEDSLSILSNVQVACVNLGRLDGLPLADADVVRHQRGICQCIRK
jgi:hypothetical protein